MFAHQAFPACPLATELPCEFPPGTIDLNSGTTSNYPKGATGSLALARTWQYSLPPQQPSFVIYQHAFVRFPSQLKQAFSSPDSAADRLAFTFVLFLHDKHSRNTFPPRICYRGDPSPLINPSIMPDESQNTSELSDHAETGGTKEDAETTAARRELKQTSISEKGGARPADESASDDDGSKDGESAARSKTPDPNTSEDRLKEQVASPKKKRAHDQLEEPKESEDSASTGGGASNGHNGTASLSRTDRSEPEKKRPRDKHADGSGANDGNEVMFPSLSGDTPPPVPMLTILRC